MKFKHSLNVFIDNFSLTYKHLLYRLIISIIALGAYIAIIMPFINELTGSPDFNNLVNGLKDFLKNLVTGESLQLAETAKQIQRAFTAIKNLIAENRANIIWGLVGMYAVHFVAQFFTALGNYATAAVINDKMALRANSPFMVTLTLNLKEACLYSICYVPLSLLYDALLVGILYLLVFSMFSALPPMFLPLQLFVFVTAFIVALAFKLVFTADWLPALIRGKMKPLEAFKYTFNRRGKQTFIVFSNFVVLVLLIFAVNVIGILFTFGAGGLLTIPSSYLILLCFEFVNYYDREELKYFIDKHTLIKPEKEKPLTREEFFKGE